MLTRTQAEDPLRARKALPPEKPAEAFDYILRLRDRHAPPAVDEGAAWTNEDIRDVAAAALDHADREV